MSSDKKSEKICLQVFDGMDIVSLLIKQWWG